MDIETLLFNALKAEQLEKHFRFIRPLVSHGIQIRPTENANSCIGGKPLVHDGFVWPEHARGHHCLIAQLDCVELPHNSKLPGTGLLTFFAAHDPDGDSWSWEKEFMQIHYHENVDRLHESTLDVPGFDRIPVASDLRYSLPFNRYLREDWPWDEEDHDGFEYGVSGDLADVMVDDSGDFLLGHAPGSRIAGNPCPGAEWELLFLLRTHEELKMYWGDDSALMVFIESDALARRDFSNVKCTIG